MRAYKQWKEKPDQIYSRISFAWEDEVIPGGNPYAKPISKALTAIKDCTVIVVIGYSFPLFNREIDKQILHAMPKVEQVYIQDLEPEVIRERFQSIRGWGDDKFKLVRNTDQFVFPPQLST